MASQAHSSEIGHRKTITQRQVTAGEPVWVSVITTDPLGVSEEVAVIKSKSRHSTSSPLNSTTISRSGKAPPVTVTPSMLSRASSSVSTSAAVQFQSRSAVVSLVYPSLKVSVNVPPVGLAPPS